MSTFNSQSVITEHISEADLRAYFVGFDFGKYRYEDFAKVLMSAIVDFAFGFHSGILEKYTDEVLKEAAQSIYKINDFSEVKWIYVDDDSSISDEDLKNEKKYLKRGEFGELILHVLLRDFANTIPLLSKIYFKDTDGVTVHGFDGVHIGKDITGTHDTLYFGETKFYARTNDKAGEAGVKDLINDVKEHFKRDFLKREFSLIGKKKHSYLPLEEYEDKNTIENYEKFIEQKKSWYQKISDAEKGNIALDEFLGSVTIPLLCTYESTLLTKYNDTSNLDFIKEYNEQIKDLQTIFTDNLKLIETELGEPIRTDLNIILLLFPIPNKKELVKLLHEKLYHRAHL